MLWVGWFGFNAGSALAAGSVAGMAMVVTHIAAATAAFTWMLAEWVRRGRASVLGIATGAIAGLGAITPASGYVGPAGALIIGLTAGFLCFIACTSVKQALGYDDALNVFGVHGVSGFVGVMLTGVFAAQAFGGSQEISVGRQFMAQGIGAGATILYSGVLTFIIAKVLDSLMGLRVAAYEEAAGLDSSLHDEKGFSL